MEKDTESTATSLDENTEDNFCDNPTVDLITEGIVGLFKSSVVKLNEVILQSKTTQLELKDQLEALSFQLDEIIASQRSTEYLNEYVRKILNIKHKATVISNILQNTEERLNKIEGVINREQVVRQSILKNQTVALQHK